MPVTYAITPDGSAEPLTRADAKLHLREDGADQDALIDALVAAAREVVEGATGRRLMPCTVVERLDGFPCDGGPIRPTVVPVRALTSIAYVDSDGATQTWDAADYRADLVSEPARIEPAYGGVYPTAREVVNAVALTYTAGYADAAAVPAALKQAMLLLVGHWYANREAVSVGAAVYDVPQAVKLLLNRWAVYGR